MPKLLELVDIENVPKFMGGQNEASFLSDTGPWNDFEVVDSAEPGAVVGVRRKADGPDGKIWTHKDLMMLENPIVTDGGVMESNGATTFGPDG